MDNATRALDAFRGGRTCAQAVLAAYGPDLGVPQALADDLAKAFVGGMAFSGGTCGVVTAAFMVLGLRFDGEAAVARGNLLAERFTDKYGTLACNGLLGCDISTGAGRRFMKEQGLRETRCAGLVAGGCAILDALLADGGKA